LIFHDLEKVKEFLLMKRFAFALLFLPLLGPTVRAGIMKFDVGNSALQGNNSVSSPYAHVTISGNTATGVLTISIDTAGNPAKFGAFGFDLKGISASDFTAKVDSSTGGNSSTWALSSGGNMDGFGSFKEEFGPSTNAQSKRLSTLTFELDFFSGKFGEAVPASIEALNAGGGNGPGFYFALEYFPNTGNTGFAGVNTLGPNPVVPEPSTLALAGIAISGLLCFWAVSRRKAIAA
jgi:hypothetical protein